MTVTRAPRGVLAVTLVTVSALTLTSLLSGCATGQRSSGVQAAGAIRVVAAESFWGSLAAQLGGAQVTVTSVVDNPNADPHDYEPTAADARAVAEARLVLVNGLGYDAWATKLVEANPAPGRTVLNVGTLVGVAVGGNPHRWYSPTDVRTVIDRITEAYTKLSPAQADFFRSRHDEFLNSTLKSYFGVIAEIRAAYAGTPVGASESVVALLCPDLGLDLITPASFLTAVSHGEAPTAADKAAADAQLRNRQVKVYVYNSQNANPDVQAQVTAAKAAGIPVTTVTETPVPAGASFQDWQVAQLTALQRALATATGK